MILQQTDPTHLIDIQEEVQSSTEQRRANDTSASGNPITLFSPGDPIIAVDLDDVLSQTNAAIADWHNDNYGSPGEISFSNFYYFYYWKNPFWGTPEVTHRKVREFYQTDWITQVLPVPGAKDGVEALRQLGYRLVIVTARNKNVEHVSWQWVKRHFGDAFEYIICTGQFGVYKDFHANKEHEIATKSSKAEVCIDIGAKLLIDDSVENAMACVEYVTPSGAQGVPPSVLLFGSYEWNKRLSRRSTDERDEMAYANRVEAEGGNQFLERDVMLCEQEVAAADSKLVNRVKDWSEAVKYVAAEKAVGRL